MEEIPAEWIDKIFAILAGFFGKRWDDLHSESHSKDISKKIWKNGLVGLSYEEVRAGLYHCKKMAQGNTLPPTVIEFFHYSKGTRLPHIPVKPKEYPLNKEFAAKSIAQMKSYLGRPHERNKTALPK